MQDLNERQIQIRYKFGLFMSNFIYVVVNENISSLSDVFKKIKYKQISIFSNNSDFYHLFLHLFSDSRNKQFWCHIKHTVVNQVGIEAYDECTNRDILTYNLDSHIFITNSIIAVHLFQNVLKKKS
jgi:hypothetical protein